MVGAVVAHGPDVVGRGYHAEYGALHAEPAAMRDAGPRARNATLYVTLEPCTHQGQTPPCVDAIIESGISRVVIATRDLNPTAAGGVERLRTAGIAVDVGLDEEAARELNAQFFHALASTRPWVVLKLAISIDGAITDAKRSAGWLTGTRARRVVHLLRAGHDAVGVGIGTVLADDPLLTVRAVPAPRVPPTRVIFDRSARLPVDSKLVRSIGDAPVFLVTAEARGANARVLASKGVRIIDAADNGTALVALRELGIRSVLMEGGAGLAGSLMKSGHVDRLIIFRAPVLLGKGAIGAFSEAPSYSLDHAPRLRVVEQRGLGSDEMTIYAMR
jgi:diaminohydroxyphosphoribosylaminopyrimidine deaminase/5-amino-6-(5-phosphoribosylamino)uracil reductase